jgi:cytochrome c-type biogenesis protein CcmF
MAAVFLIAEMVAPGIHLLPALGLAIAAASSSPACCR